MSDANAQLLDADAAGGTSHLDLSGLPASGDRRLGRTSAPPSGIDETIAEVLVALALGAGPDDPVATACIMTPGRAMRPDGSGRCIAIN